MARFRKEANLGNAAQAANTVAKGVKGLGKGLWGATRVFGKSPVQRVGGAAATTYALSSIPEMARKAKRGEEEAMIPWQGQKVRL